MSLQVRSGNRPERGACRRCSSSLAEGPRRGRKRRTAKIPSAWDMQIEDPDSGNGTAGSDGARSSASASTFDPRTTASARVLARLPFILSNGTEEEETLRSDQDFAEGEPSTAALAGGRLQFGADVCAMAACHRRGGNARLAPGDAVALGGSTSLDWRRAAGFPGEIQPLPGASSFNGLSNWKSNSRQAKSGKIDSSDTRRTREGLRNRPLARERACPPLHFMGR